MTALAKVVQCSKHEVDEGAENDADLGSAGAPRASTYLCPLTERHARDDFTADERRVGDAGGDADGLLVVFGGSVGDGWRGRQTHGRGVNRRSALFLRALRRLFSSGTLVSFCLRVEEVGQRLILEEEPRQEREQEADQEAVQNRRKHALLCG